MHERSKWIRDWALLGAFTSGLAGLAPDLIGIGMVPDSYAPTCAGLGAVSGAGVGLALFEVLSRCADRSRVAVAMVLALTLLGGWGALVATTAAWLVVPNLASLGVPAGWVAGVLQTGWVAPAYAAVARSGGPRWPLVVAGTVAAPICGMAGAVMLLMVMEVT